MRSTAWSGLVLLLWGLSGCATVPPAAELAAATSSFAFSGGRGVQSFAAAPPVVAEALVRAMNDLDLQSPTRSRGGAIHRIEARTSDRRPVVAMVRPHQGTSHVAIRIGWFGDEPLARTILERVGVHLGSRPPEAIPATAPSTPSRNPFFSREAVPDSVMLRDFAEAPYRDRVIP